MQGADGGRRYLGGPQGGLTNPVARLPKPATQPPVSQATHRRLVGYRQCDQWVPCIGRRDPTRCVPFFFHCWEGVVSRSHIISPDDNVGHHGSQNPLVMRVSNRVPVLVAAHGERQVPKGTVEVVHEDGFYVSRSPGCGPETGSPPSWLHLWLALEAGAVCNGRQRLGAPSALVQEAQRKLSCLGITCPLQAVCPFHVAAVDPEPSEVWQTGRKGHRPILGALPRRGSNTANAPGRSVMMLATHRCADMVWWCSAITGDHARRVAHAPVRPVRRWGPAAHCAPVPTPQHCARSAPSPGREDGGGYGCLRCCHRPEWGALAADGGSKFRSNDGPPPEHTAQSCIAGAWGPGNRPCHPPSVSAPKCTSSPAGDPACFGFPGTIAPPNRREQTRHPGQALGVPSRPAPGRDDARGGAGAGWMQAPTLCGARVGHMSEYVFTDGMRARQMWAPPTEH